MRARAIILALFLLRSRTHSRSIIIRKIPIFSLSLDPCFYLFHERLFSLCPNFKRKVKVSIYYYFDILLIKVRYLSRSGYKNRARMRAKAIILFLFLLRSHTHSRSVLTSRER